MAVSLALKLVVVVALAFLTANQPADNKNMHNNCPETGMMMPIPNVDGWVFEYTYRYMVVRFHPAHRRHMVLANSPIHWNKFAIRIIDNVFRWYC